MSISANIDDLKTSFDPKTFVPVLSAGLITALLDIIINISFAAIIFSGNLSVFLPRGIGIAFFSTTIMCLILTFTSGFRGLISVTQDSAVAIVAVFSGHVAVRVSDPTAHSTFITVVMFITISTTAAGIMFFLLGRFRLGNLVRFIPYPVIGGFLAAIGIILFQGGFSLLTEHQLILEDVDDLMEMGTLSHWLPAVVFGIVLFIVTRRVKHFLTMPAMLALGIIVFFVVVLVSGESIDTVQDKGWMLGPFPEETSWKPVFMEDLSEVNWDIILDEVGHIPTIALVGAIALLLNISAMEIQVDEEVKTDYEMQQTGIGNILVGLTGGMLSFHTLSISLLAWRMDGKNRLVGLIFVTVYIVVLIFGFSLIAFFPRFVLAGLLIFLGIDIMTEWVYDGWFKMPHQEYVVMILILITIITVGYLQGVGLGILGATLLFAYDYSRLDVIKNVLSGKSYQSKVVRPRNYRYELQDMGERLAIYRLTGFIFFGSASNLYDTIIARLHDTSLPPLEYLVMDFQQVKSIDSSAVLTYIKLRQLLRKHGVKMIITNLNDHIMQIFLRSDFQLDPENVVIFGDMDEGVEWCEDRMLRGSSVTRVIDSTEFKHQLQAMFPGFTDYDEFITYLTRREVAAGEYIATRGEAADSLFFVESGRLRAQIEMGNKTRRLRTAMAGSIMGEIALYSGAPRSAAIVADENSVIYELTQESMLHLEDDHPAIAARFHRLVAGVLSERLSDTTDSLRHVME